MKTSLLIALTLLIAVSQAQKPVVQPWANDWYADFTETIEFPLRGHDTTKGKWWYSWTQKAFRVDRENGNYDRYCGLTKKFQNTPCTQIVTGGTRYLYFPKDKYCCNCCSAAHGCGITKPTWTATGEFVGSHTDSKGVSYNEWNIQGGMKNIWGATTDNKAYRLYQEPLSDMLWDVTTYSTDAIPSSVFDLPSKDCKHYCPFFSICTEIRASAFFRKEQTKAE